MGGGQGEQARGSVCILFGEAGKALLVGASRVLGQAEQPCAGLEGARLEGAVALRSSKEAPWMVVEERV